MQSAEPSDHDTAPLWRRTFLHVRGPALPFRTGISILVAMVATVVITGAMASDGNVSSRERSVLEFFNGWPDRLEPVFSVVQEIGVLDVMFVVGAAIAIISRRLQYALPFVFLSIYKFWIEKRLIQRLVDRRRPFTSVGPEINARGSADLDGPSFPSGHTTTAVATGILVSFFLPSKWKPLPIVWGFSVGIIRLYYGEHNPLDVVASYAVAIFFVTSIHLLLINRWVGDGPVLHWWRPDRQSRSQQTGTR